MDVFWIDDSAVQVVPLESNRIDRLREMQFICVSNHAICPRLIFLHDHVATNWPVVFSLVCVVKIRSPKIRSKHHKESIRDIILFRIIPQIVNPFCQQIQSATLPGIVIVVCIEPP